MHGAPAESFDILRGDVEAESAGSITDGVEAQSLPARPARAHGALVPRTRARYPVRLPEIRRCRARAPVPSSRAVDSTQVHSCVEGV